MKTTFKRKAFTLIELLIVIAIIGILFIVLVSKVDFATDKAKATGVQTDFRSFQVAFEQVARENSGFNTFGWDEGDKADPSLYAGRTPDGQTYTYANESQDRGDRIRNSYDAGDANLNGRQESGETWTGRKIYTETWTGIYTLENPATGTDKHANDNAVIDLENAINKNLDPKLHITIADHVDGTTLGAAADSGQDQGKVYYITMKNQAVDPWKTEYVGKYLTNASANSTTNSIDANKAPMNPQPMVGSLDRGAIIIYSKGANLELGSHEEIINGSVVVYVSLKDDERVDHNTAGQDDYSISTIYTFKNGYGEVISTTTGFSVNQGGGQAGTNGTFVPGNGNEPNTPDTPNLPEADPTKTLNDYTWSQIKALAQANLSADELRDTYGIEVGDYKEVNGIKYILVDLGTDNDGDGIQEAEEDYDGFVFMYNSGIKKQMNSTSTNQGGYVSTDVIKPYVDRLYTNLADAELKSAIKKVTITCNSGDLNADGTDDNGMSTYTTDAYMFLASSKEVGFTFSGYQYAAEGAKFDLFVDQTARANFATLANISSNWWLRSAISNLTAYFYYVYTNGLYYTNNATNTYAVVPAFVIG